MGVSYYPWNYLPLPPVKADAWVKRLRSTSPRPSVPILSPKIASSQAMNVEYPSLATCRSS